MGKRDGFFLRWIESYTFFEFLSYIIISCIIIVGFIAGIIYGFSDKHIDSYTLGNYGKGSLQIRVDIENCNDDFIMLNGMTFEEATKLVKELNNTIK